MELQAVLFDMDGTIVDTEPYWIEAEYALVRSHGGSWSDAHAHALVGNALLESAEYLRAHGGVALDPALIVEQLVDDVLVAAQRDIPWRPGAVALITALGQQGIPCGLVTMSYARLAQTVVEALHAGAFTTVVTGDEVVNGKPHPESYLTAAERLGVDPRRCVAIEDSPTGIAAASAAGCVVVAVPHHVPVPEGAARLTVTSLEDLDPETLETLVSEAR